MRSTLQQTYHYLAQGSLLHRYAHGTADGLPAGEGAFGICSFWAVACRARSGDPDGARQAFEDLLACANDVGLYAEEIDPADHAALGNFPQAFTHVGLIDAALAIAEQLREAPAQPVLTDQSRQALTNREKENNHA
jgi:GH15 family glucan-1,4-alpha-glucosidase